jgi:ribosomal protein S12 methylthiotransferase accessory factor
VTRATPEKLTSMYDRETKRSDLHKLIDDKFGPLSRFRVQKLERPKPEWWLATAAVARYPIGSWSAEAAAGAGGASLDRQEAIARCLGEGAERYAALNSMATLETQIRPSADALLNRFPRCDAREPCWNSLKGIDPTEQITQTPVKRLDTDAPVWVPAGHVHLGFVPSESEKPVTLPISTGLAFSPGLAQAIWRGLCEVAERDAIMLSWLANRPKAMLAFSIDAADNAIASEIRSRLDALRTAAIRPLLFDISIDFRAPVVLCLLQSEEIPFLTVGASCHEDPVRACCKAIDEAVSVRVALPLTRSTPRHSDDFRAIDTLDAHALLYAHWQNSPAVKDFGSHVLERRPLTDFLESAFPPTPNSLTELRDIAQRMSGEGLSVLWVDLTTSDLIDLGHVVRVLVPEFMPLSQRYDARWLATPRLHRFLGERGVSLADINTYPHPFA